MQSVIFGIKGTTLSDEEKKFFHETNPVGFILFSRNLETIEQVKNLIQDLKETVGRDKVPILIDQEGGRVQRIGPKLGYIKFPPAKIFGDIAQEKDFESVKKLCQNNYQMIGLDLFNLGITVDCAPCIDLFHESTDKVIGDRSFSNDPKIVSDLGQAAIYGLKESGIMPIIKHIPGHGRALVDSHHALPQVTQSLKELEHDFIPFKELSSHAEIAMTAHICYTAIDPELPLTLSAKGIDFVRKNIGFKGVLISDDLSMKALSGTLSDIAKQAYQAGCDLLLHCNGNIEEMREIAAIDIPVNQVVHDTLIKDDSYLAQIMNDRISQVDEQILLGELREQTGFEYTSCKV